MNDPRSLHADGNTRDEVQEALRPLASLLSKCEKAQRKLAAGSWQHAMLRDNVNALRLAVALMDKKPGGVEVFAKDDWLKTLRALASMIDKTAKAQARFPPGTSQHTLQRNRLKALRMAEARMKARRGMRRARRKESVRAATKRDPQ